MQQFPRFYLSKYFDELKNQIDTKYALKQNDVKNKYLEIIKNIESFEQDAYNKWLSKSINTCDNEIKLIEERLNDLNLTEITSLIEKVKYKIEKMLFSNKSIFFIETKCRNSFLLILNDAFIWKSCLNSKSEILLTRDQLKVFILKNKLQKSNINSFNALNLDINIENQTEINMSNENIIHVDQFTFNSMVNL